MEKEIEKPNWISMQEYENLVANSEAGFGVVVRPSAYGHYTKIKFRDRIEVPFCYYIVLVTEAGCMTIGTINVEPQLLRFNSNWNSNWDYQTECYRDGLGFEEGIDWLVSIAEQRMNRFNACLEPDATQE